MQTSISNRALAASSIVCALIPPISLLTAPIPKPGLNEFLLILVFGAVIPGFWLGLTIACYRRLRTTPARWLFALAPVAFIYALGALILGIGVLIKPGKW